MITGNNIVLEFVWKEWMRDADRGRVYSRVMVKAKTGRSMINAILNDLERLHNDEQSRNFEIGYSIISQLIDYGHFVTLYRIFSSEQMNGRLTMLIKVLDSKIHAFKNGFPDFLSHTELKKIAALVRQLCLRAIFVMQQVIDGQAPPSALEIDDVSEVYTALVLILQITATLLTITDKGHPEFKALLVEDNTVVPVTDLLRQCETIDQKKQPGFNYLKRDSVRLLGALCYDDRELQDKIREIGGIPLILAQCRIEDSNPYLREYAILALRNILKDNHENQALIAGMEPKEVVQTEELTEMGLRAKLVDGEVKLEKEQ
ncbi:spinocerebellar ataxia type 10 protein domain-containing protein [Fennellomyces sp. T-0311]|nr:spinocerebellar ataxia type 10 protein domain-containing protein [Fennellomyces sp. T-0311]